MQVPAIKELLDISSASRSTGCTGANADSSRSHCILQFTLKRNAAGMRGETEEALVVGKISFIDLAGSERGADTSDSNRHAFRAKHLSCFSMTKIIILKIAMTTI
jgi:kinesin family protein 2/24